MKILLIIALFIPSFVLAESKSCSITTFDKVYYLPTKNKSKARRVIKKTDCPEFLVGKFTKQIFNSSGTLSQRILNSNEDIAKSGYKINLFPKRVIVTNLKDKLKRHFELGNKWSFGKLKMLNKNIVIGLNKDDTIDLNCEFCHTTGEKNISFTVYNAIKNYSKTHWVSATVYISTAVLVPKRAISPSEPQLVPSDFELKNLNVIRPEKYFTNKEKLVFYKLNKAIVSGKGLMFTDLSPVNLVSAGVPTKIILRNKTLSLESQGIPSQSGKFGEIIKLRNPKTKRVISGKVIDFNKVLVDL